MMKNVLLIGCGQHCGVVMYNIEEQGCYHVVGLVDSDASKWGKEFHGKTVLGGYDPETLEKIKREHEVSHFFIAFGSMKQRKKVFEYMCEQGWGAVNVIHPQAVVSPKAKIGTGVLIECGCLVTPAPVIGDNVVINTGSQVNHDNVIGNHAYIASGVILSGGVSIGENTLLDDGVIVTMGVSVGKNCLIGAGSVVTKDVEDGVVAYGAPCRVIRVNSNV